MGNHPNPNQQLGEGCFCFVFNLCLFGVVGYGPNSSGEDVEVDAHRRSIVEALHGREDPEVEGIMDRTVKSRSALRLGLVSASFRPRKAREVGLASRICPHGSGSRTSCKVPFVV